MHADLSDKPGAAESKAADAAVQMRWRDNPRRFMLNGLPQIGKTGAFLWLTKLLFDEVHPSTFRSVNALPSTVPTASGTQCAQRATSTPSRCSPVDPPVPELLPEPAPRWLENMGAWPKMGLMGDFNNSAGKGKYGDPMDEQQFRFWTSPPDGLPEQRVEPVVACQEKHV